MTRFSPARSSGRSRPASSSETWRVRYRLPGELAARGVERDLVDPGPDLAPGRVVRRGPEPHPREGLLQPLLGERAPPPGQPEEDAEDRPLVPPVKGGERVRVATGHPFEERAVREDGHGGDARWYRLGGAPGQGRQQRERQDGCRAHGLEALLPAGSYRARPPRVAGGKEKTRRPEAIRVGFGLLARRAFRARLVWSAQGPEGPFEGGWRAADFHRHPPRRSPHAVQSPRAGALSLRSHHRGRGALVTRKVGREDPAVKEKLREPGGVHSRTRERISTRSSRPR